MRIVIVSANFSDRRRIGSRRPRSLAFWLASFGHEVTVVTQAADVCDPLPDGPDIEVVAVPRRALFRRAHTVARRFNSRLQAQSEPGGIPAPSSGSRLARGDVTTRWRVVSTASLAFRAIDDFAWAARAARESRLNVEPEIIFSTYGPLSSLWLGWHLARVWPSAVWVADFRDLVAGDSYPPLIDRMLTRIQRHAVTRAGAVTTISRGLHDGLADGLPAEVASKVRVLPNGFEPMSQPVPSAGAEIDQTLRVGYTGNMYGGRRDASALFEAIRDLIDLGVVARERVEVHYAGKESTVFVAQAAYFDVDDIVVDHGFVDAEEARRIQSLSDVLLVLSWNTRGEQGILTGKVFEYLASGRPILAITAGDLARAELTELVEDLGLGFAFEYVDSVGGTPQLRAFLRDAYERRQRRERLSVRATAAIRAYEYQSIARRLEQLFLLQLA